MNKKRLQQQNTLAYFGKGYTVQCLALSVTFISVRLFKGLANNLARKYRTRREVPGTDSLLRGGLITGVISFTLQAPDLRDEDKKSVFHDLKENKNG